MQLFLNMPVIQFFLRSNNDKAKNQVLYCRITLNRTTAEFSTKEKVFKTDWDQQNQKHKSKDKTKDRYIQSLIETTTYKIKTKAIHLSEAITAKELLDQMHQKPKEVVLLTNLIERYISDISATGRSAPGTIKNHKIKNQNLELYQSYTRTKYTAESFDLVEAEKFKDWFQDHKATNNVTTANRNVLFYKNALQHAAKKGLIKNFSLSLFVGEKDKIKEPIYLTENEVLRLISHQFESVMLQKVKDLYLFQITTGLSFADLWSKFQVECTESGKVLTGARAKNGQEFFVPLDPVAEMILGKYENKLPIYCNAVYNRMLKEIAGILSIDKKLTTHTGRKTFATLQDSKGWSRESIALMLGHRSVKTTEMYYIGNSFARIENEFRSRV
jgi:site-specific recombinase XerD